jgi:hypothetical protein
MQGWMEMLHGKGCEAGQPDGELYLFEREKLRNCA